MLCAAYKSIKKVDTYLYVSNKDDFSKVPEALLKAFGTPQFVMSVPVDKREHIAQIPKSEFVAKLQEQGFYLQMPPTSASLLKMHLQQQSQQQ
ncbi:YcgL domain-containing protein [Glaciecola sp. XM2]|jgi:uncharacterized protein YcgL (UPF0745 family)|uniref:YcgL domain-containing protein n=1 Tax=Glaciecola sp. XM2 TaxID=1914931 RepID=UPI001BDF0C59|nr:YcgL domain-containing protein [Glaciecola sp. XM2]MBT1450953.1 YcgL domain-containing protein [Glaciecola sp. XM2]